MPLQYDIARTPRGWAVLEDGATVEVRPTRRDAEEIADLLAWAMRAAGRPAGSPGSPASI